MVRGPAAPCASATLDAPGTGPMGHKGPFPGRDPRCRPPLAARWRILRQCSEKQTAAGIRAFGMSRFGSQPERRTTTHPSHNNRPPRAGSFGRCPFVIAAASLLWRFAWGCDGAENPSLRGTTGLPCTDKQPEFRFVAAPSLELAFHAFRLRTSQDRGPIHSVHGPLSPYNVPLQAAHNQL